jgi:hypothetical protein
LIWGSLNKMSRRAVNFSKEFSVSIFRLVRLPWRCRLSLFVKHFHSRIEHMLSHGLVIMQDYCYSLLFYLALQPRAGYGLLVHAVSWSHTTMRHSR